MWAFINQASLSWISAKLSLSWTLPSLAALTSVPVRTSPASYRSDKMIVVAGRAVIAQEFNSAVFGFCIQRSQSSVRQALMWWCSAWSNPILPQNVGLTD